MAVLHDEATHGAAERFLNASARFSTAGKLDDDREVVPLFVSIHAHGQIFDGFPVAGGVFLQGITIPVRLQSQHFGHDQFRSFLERIECAEHVFPNFGEILG